MNRLVFLIVMMMSLNTFAQSKYETSKDAENGSLVFKGEIGFNDLGNETSFEWFKNYSSYKPDTAAIAFLKQNLKDHELVVVMGTWCEDSHNLIPKLYQVLKLSNYPMDKLQLVGVDRSKDALNGEKGKYNIERVPTIILLNNETELGRITESVQESVEQDIIKLILGH